MRWRGLYQLALIPFAKRTEQGHNPNSDDETEEKPKLRSFKELEHPSLDTV